MAVVGAGMCVIQGWSEHHAGFGGVWRAVWGADGVAGVSEMGGWGGVNEWWVG